MSLESVLADLVVALNANTAALKSAPSVTAAAPAAVVEKKEKAPKADKPKEETKPAETAASTTTAVVFPTVNDIRNAAQSYLDANKNSDEGVNFPALAAKYGAKKLTEVSEDKRAEVIATINAALAKLKEAPKADSAI